MSKGYLEVAEQKLEVTIYVHTNKIDIFLQCLILKHCISLRQSMDKILGCEHGTENVRLAL